tara:strand:+ start:265 stop:603 length:339 start_codon:yes stop_codon:yes gene_type:complete
MSGRIPDVGNVGITSSGGVAIATTASGAAGWINENAIYIGLAISIISLIVGVIFKIMAGIRSERHHKERMFEEAQQNAKALNILRAEIRAELGSKSDSNVTSHTTHTDDNRE